MRYIITGIFLAIFLGVASLLLVDPPSTGKALTKPEMDNSFRQYFVLSTMINYQTNTAVHQITKDLQDHSQLQKPVQEYFNCNTLLKQIRNAERLRTQIMNSFQSLQEMNCFHKIAESDWKKFKLLKQQCRSETFNTELPQKISKEYQFQKEALNKGCMQQSELFELLRTTRVEVIRAR